MHLRYTILFFASLIMASPTFAAKPTEPGPADPRIRSVAYSARDVVQIFGHYGFTTTIEFGPDEVIETVSIGDSEAWQIIKANQPNLLFVKPIEQQADTNMTVVTTKRLYSFMLFARQAENHFSEKLTFHVKFKYPNEATAAIAYQIRETERIVDQSVTGHKVAPDNWNFEYQYSGDEALRPTRVFDDGRFTYFRFSEIISTPAIFIVDQDGNEEVVNFASRDGYIVVERLSRQFTLRDGDVTVCIFNRAYPTPEFDDGAPKLVTGAQK